MGMVRWLVVILSVLGASFASEGQELALFGVVEPHCGPPQTRLRLVGAIEGTVIVDVYQSGPELFRKDAFYEKTYDASVRLCTDDAKCSSTETKVHFARSSKQSLRGDFVATLPPYGVLNIHFRTELPDGKKRHMTCE